jgi:hypothetical protein
MNDAKYLGLEVDQATISVAAILDSAGTLVMEAILETKGETISPVYPRPAQQFAWNLRRRNLCRLVARSAQTRRLLGLPLHALFR